MCDTDSGGGMSPCPCLKNIKSIIVNTHHVYIYMNSYTGSLPSQKKLLHLHFKNSRCSFSFYFLSQIKEKASAYNENTKSIINAFT